MKHLGPGWFATVLGLTGLSLAWHAAAPLLGEPATAAALAIGAAAALAFLALCVGAMLRWQRHPEAWSEDLRHPVRHAFVAAMPISLTLLVTSAVTAGGRGPVLEALWWTGCLLQLAVTLWVMSRWWRAPATGASVWPGITPILFIPSVGNAIVPLAGVPLGHEAWAAAQFGIGVFLWPVVLVLLLVRIGVQGLWPERLLPSTFIVIAPPAVVGLSVLRLEAPLPLVWGLWGIALFCGLWAGSLLKRIAAQPFGMAHWGLSFPMAALTALTLRLAPSGPLSLLGLALLAFSSLLVAGLSLATVRGLRAGTLLVAETVPIGMAAAPAGR